MKIAVPRFALTVIQPWATLLVEGPKDVENRIWMPGSGQLRPGGWFWVHAGAKFDEAAAQLVTGGRGVPTEKTERARSRRSGIVGAVRYTGSSKSLRSAWYVPGQWGWMIDDRVAFPDVIPCGGKLGLWAPTDAVQQAAEKAFAGAMAAQ